MNGQVVVVEGGLAGAKMVQGLRERGYDGRVVLFGAETERPYERPPLSKGYLQGGDERDSAFVHAAGVVRGTTTSTCGWASTVIGGLLQPADDVLDGSAHPDRAGTTSCSRPAREPRRLDVPGAGLYGGGATCAPSTTATRLRRSS